MDSGRQVIRWALPGWIAFMFWTMFIAIDTIFHGQNQPLYLTILRKMNSLVIPLSVASIPLGFVFYQLYYWVYWYLPFPSISNPMSNRKIIDPIDRGKQILVDLIGRVDFKVVFENPLIQSEPTAFKKWGPLYIKSIEVMRDYRQNWHLSDSAWYLALSDERFKNVVDFLEKRNQMLSDIYHSLGACYQALVFSFCFYLVALGWITLIDIRMFFENQTALISFSTALIVLWGIFIRLLSFSINTGIFYFAFSMFKGGRIASFDALLTLKHDVITNVLLDRPTIQVSNSDDPSI